MLKLAIYHTRRSALKCFFGGGKLPGSFDFGFDFETYFCFDTMISCYYSWVIVDTFNFSRGDEKILAFLRFFSFFMPIYHFHQNNFRLIGAFKFIP